MSLCPYVRTSVHTSHFHFFRFPAVISQNVTDKRCLACVKSKEYASWVTLRPQWDRCRRGEAEVRILDFKTTWSEFQKSSETTVERGKAELRTLNFKTTWSEFQKPSDTAGEWGKAKQVCILNFRTTRSEFQKLKQTIAPNSIPLLLYVVLELKIHSSSLSSSVSVWLGVWNSEPDETRKWATGQWDGPPLPYGRKDMNVKILMNKAGTSYFLVSFENNEKSSIYLFLF